MLKILQILAFNTFLCADFSVCSDDFFIAHKYLGSQYYCITNSSFALSWIAEDTTTTRDLHQVSRFLPVSHNFWRAGRKDFKIHQWQRQEFISDEIILDRRWEGIKEYKTNYLENKDDQNSSFSFTPVDIQLFDNFQIALSIRVGEEAHIFLCDGSNVTTSNCYWLALHELGGIRSAFRKCPSNRIASSNRESLNDPCNTPKSQIYHFSEDRKILSKKKWNHFVLAKNGTSLTFTNQNGTDLLRYEDNDTSIYQTKFMIIHSKPTTGLWKIHKFEYFKIALTKRTEFSKPISPIDGRVHVSMFVRMCEKCKMFFEITEVVRGYVLSGRQLHHPRQPTRWSEFTFRNNDIKGRQILFVIKPNNDDGDTDPYWEISDIKQHQKDGFRMIQLDDRANCQLMAPESDVISVDDKVSVARTKPFRPLFTSDFDHCTKEDTVSKYCIPCDWFLNAKCETLKFCEKYSGVFKCSCSSGYRTDNTEINCISPCPDDKYGLECGKQCSKDCPNCNKTTGACTSCPGNNRGCDMPPEEVKNLKGKAISDTAVELKWQRPDKINGDFVQYVVKYQIVQYLACDDIHLAYNPKIAVISNVTSATLSNLNPYTKYQFFVSAKNTKYEGDMISISVNTIQSGTISENEIPELEPRELKNNRILLVFSALSCTNFRGPLSISITVACSKPWCTKRYIQQLKYDGLRVGKSIGILPFSDYSLLVQFCRNQTACSPMSRTETFLSDVDAPHAVNNLSVYSRNDHSISVRWRPPYPPTGILELYKISASLVGSSKKTDFGNVMNSTCSLWPDFLCFTLTELQPDQKYSIEVQAKNEKPDAFGVPAATQSETKTEPSRPPPDLAISWTLENDLEITWKHPTEAEGDITNFNISVLASEPNQTGQNISADLPLTQSQYRAEYRHVIQAAKLSASTEYKISVGAYNGLNGEESSLTDSSPPDIPTLDPEPQFNVLNHTIGVTIFLKDFQGRTDNLRIIILSSDEETNVDSYQELQKFDLRGLRVFIDCNFTFVQNHLIFIILGQNQTSPNCQDMNNNLMEKYSFYNITMILINTYNSKSRSAVYSQAIGITNSGIYYYGLFALLLIIPAVVFCYMKRKTKQSGKLQVNNIGQSNVQGITDQMLLIKLEPKIKKKNQNKNTVDIDDNPLGQSEPVSVKDFDKYFRTALENDALKKQYENILETVLIYETLLVDTLRSDYVDMNFKSGAQIKNAYITTKLPTVAEFNEFWKTVADENIRHIILFAHLQPNQKKSKTYWPDVGSSLRYGNITIECNMCQKYTFYTHRSFSLKCKNKIQKVDQLHLALPPKDSRYLSSSNYAKFFHKMSKIPQSSKSPILVHSSTNMGGISFVLLCDMSLRTAQKDGTIDVMSNFKMLIQTTSEMKIEFDHYVAVHAIIADTLRHMETSIACNSFDSSQSELFTNEEVQKQLQYLRDTLWLDGIVIEEQECYVNCSTILLKSGQVVQQGTSSGKRSQPEESDFVRVGGFKAPGKFWVAKRSASMTLSDFLENVHQKKISVIVTLEKNIFTWPSEDHPQIFISDNITLKYKGVKKLRSYDWTTLELTTRTAIRNVDVIAFKKCAFGVSLPKISDFVNFVMESIEIFQNTEPVLVLCHDGVTSCGLYLAMSNILQQIKTEGVCDVCACVRTLRRYRQDFVRDDNQYIFLLEAAHSYMKESSLYEVR